MFFLLAQKKYDSMSVILVVLALLALTLVGGLVIMLFRRKLLSKEEEAANETLFESLRRMRDSGQMSIDEYEAARKTMVKKAAEKMNKPAATGSKKELG